MFVLFLFLESINRWVCSNLIVGKSSSSFNVDTLHLSKWSSLGCKAMSIQFISSLVYLSEFLHYQLWECSRVSYKGYNQNIYSFDDISVAEIGFKKFSYFSKIFLITFLFISVWRCPLLIFQSSWNFLFLKVFRYFPDLVDLFFSSFFFTLFTLLREGWFFCWSGGHGPLSLIGDWFFCWRGGPWTAFIDRWLAFLLKKSMNLYHIMGGWFFVVGAAYGLISLIGGWFFWICLWTYV